MASTTLYEVLGVQTSADRHEIKTAYRKLAKNTHPDVVSMIQKDGSNVEFMKINAAYSTLSDPNKRADYDRVLFTTSSRHSTLNYGSGNNGSMGSRFSGYTTSRNWETDQCW